MKVVCLICWAFLSCLALNAQNTKILGFAHVGAQAERDGFQFVFGEQDFFVTSEITDRISFLGETVFMFNQSTESQFSISVERLIISYQLKGNLQVLMGKHHTPFSYWNDTYHHGRVFFPTVFRPGIFGEALFPLHTTGISFRTLNIGQYNLGYEIMIGNGTGFENVTDNNWFKSITAAVHARPNFQLKYGAAAYVDRIDPTLTTPHTHGPSRNNLIGLYQFSHNTYLAYFGDKHEILAELAWIHNMPDDAESSTTAAPYLYYGYRIGTKSVPYVRVDAVRYQQQEAYFRSRSFNAFLLGYRHEFSYLANAKLELRYIDESFQSPYLQFNIQFAVGF